jgi:hypothetical protein
MKKIVIAALATIAAASSMAAQNNIGSCGWGSKVFAGQSGVGPQVLAATTNGTSGNQTFGITFGTSGCTQDGVVSSNWKTAMFIDGNRVALARDAAAGQGRHHQGQLRFGVRQRRRGRQPEGRAGRQHPAVWLRRHDLMTASGLSAQTGLAASGSAGNLALPPHAQPRWACAFQGYLS